MLNGDDLTRGGTTTPDPVRALNEQVGGVNLEFGVGQSVPADPVLSRVRGVGAARHAARARRLCQRRALQPGVRRHGQFRPAARHGDRPDEPGRLEPGVRPERAWRRAERAAEERLHLSRRRDRGCPAGRSTRSAAISSTASRAATPRSMSRRAACTRTAGATCNPPTSRISTAISAGAATPAKCISTSWLANSVLNGPGTSPVELLAADPAAQFTGPNQISNRFVQVSLSGNLASQRHGLAAGRHLLQQFPAARDQRQCAERHAVQRRFGPAVLRFRRPQHDARRRARSRPSSARTRWPIRSWTTRRPTPTATAPRSRRPTRRPCSASTTIWSAASASTARRPSSPAPPLSAASRPITRVFIGPGVIIDEPGSNQPVRVAISDAYYGAFVADTFNVTDRLALTASGRFNAAADRPERPERRRPDRQSRL